MEPNDSSENELIALFGNLVPNQRLGYHRSWPPAGHFHCVQSPLGNPPSAGFGLGLVDDIEQKRSRAHREV